MRVDIADWTAVGVGKEDRYLRRRVHGEDCDESPLSAMLKGRSITEPFHRKGFSCGTCRHTFALQINAEIIWRLGFTHPPPPLRVKCILQFTKYGFKLLVSLQIRPNAIRPVSHRSLQDRHFSTQYDGHPSVTHTSGNAPLSST